MSSKKFLTVKGRFEQAKQASDMAALSAKDRVLALCMFYAGFSAALEAFTEIATFTDDEAVLALTALHNDVERFEALATSILGGETKQ